LYNVLLFRSGVETNTNNTAFDTANKPGPGQEPVKSFGNCELTNQCVRLNGLNQLKGDQERR
jgi:hypothetical protein